MNHVLAAIADRNEGLVFRGGTALARIYWPDFRLSEDLDFITDIRASAAQRVLDSAVRSAADSSGADLRLEFGPPRQGWSRSTIIWPGPPGMGGISPSLIVDVNFNEKAYLPTEQGRLDLPYSDLAEAERRIEVISLSEILGNKWYMVGDDERNEPRDLFDLWAGLCRFGIQFDAVASGHRAKYGSRPQPYQLARAARLRANWEIRLSHQVRDLPQFDQVLADVRAALETWQAARQS